METQFARKVDAYLKTIPNLWFFNVHGNGIQRAGIPDRLICYKGKFIGLELKRTDSKGVVSPRQKIEISKIRDAGGIAYVIDNLDDVKSIIEDMKKE